jgi:hypothetical protein
MSVADREDYRIAEVCPTRLSDLPTEILCSVFSILKHTDVKLWPAVYLVNRRFYTIIRDLAYHCNIDDSRSWKKLETRSLLSGQRSLIRYITLSLLPMRFPAHSDIRLPALHECTITQSAFPDLSKRRRAACATTIMRDPESWDVYWAESIDFLITVSNPELSTVRWNRTLSQVSRGDLAWQIMDERARYEWHPTGEVTSRTIQFIETSIQTDETMADGESSIDEQNGLVLTIHATRRDLESEAHRWTGQTRRWLKATVGPNSERLLSKEYAVESKA